MDGAPSLADRAAVDALRAASRRATRTLYEVRARPAATRDWRRDRTRRSRSTGGGRAAHAAPSASSSRRARRCSRWERDGVAAEPIAAAAPFALFGLRACDLAAIAYQDRFFARDPAYEARRAAGARSSASTASTACDGGFCRRRRCGAVRARAASISS